MSSSNTSAAQNPAINAVRRRSRSPHRGNKTTRAPLACERCRSKKLRCVGGNPCQLCERASVICDYGDGVRARAEQLGGVDMGVRVSQLEKQVAFLAAQVERLVSGAVSGSPVSLRPDGLERDPSNRAHDTLTSSHQEYSTVSPAGNAVSSQHGQVRGTPVDRLMQVILPLRGLNAPFPPLMYHPAVWDNRSRSGTPEDCTEDRRPSMGVTDFEAKAKMKDDPVSTGLVSQSAGELLFDL